MNQVMTDTPLRDALYALSVAKPIPDAELLEEYVRMYPLYAEALTDFAIELALDALRHGDDDDLDIPADPEAVSPVVSRVMSQFQNRLFELAQRRAPEPAARVSTHSVTNPFAALDREGFRALASRLDVNAVLLSKLRDRHIDPQTIPNSFCTRVAAELDEDLDVLTGHLWAQPESGAAARQYFKAEGKPTAHGRQTFEEAVRGSDLTREQQERLLSLRD